MNQERINDYKKWLVCKINKSVSNPYDQYGWRERKAGLTFSKLYDKLWEAPYHPNPLHPLDENRWHDGRDLRKEYAYENNLDRNYILEEIPGECRMLEFLVALAIRVEFIMQDPDLLDRTPLWSYYILKSLGLWYCVDWCYDETYIDMVLERFMTNTYEPDGRGGCFYIPDTPHDLTHMQIWDQMNEFTNWRNFVGNYEHLSRHSLDTEWLEETCKLVREGKEPPDLSKYIYPGMDEEPLEDY